MAPFFYGGVQLGRSSCFCRVDEVDCVDLVDFVDRQSRKEKR